LYGGGIAGSLEGGELTFVSSGGAVKGSGSIIGGLVGIMTSGLLENSRSTADTDGGTAIGGAIGEMDNGTVRGVSASGTAYANTSESFKDGTNAGGFVGLMQGGLIEESYAHGYALVDHGYAGGFVGQIRNGTIQNAFANGRV
jgi:hypothetical protein